MLEKKHGCFDAEPHDMHVVSDETDLDAVIEEINRKLQYEKDNQSYTG